MAYPDVVLADAPYGYWRLGETAGVFADQGSGAHTGALNGTGWTRNVTGLITAGDGALQHDATANAWVQIDGMPDPGNTDFTIEAWYRADLTGGLKPDQGIAGKWDGGGYTLWVNYSSPNDFVFVVSGSSSDFVYSTVTPDAGIHHIVGTKAATLAVIYIDGVEAARKTVGLSIGAHGTPFSIGRLGTAGGTNLKGTVDDVAYYDYALSAARVAAHYTAGTTTTAAAQLAMVV